MKKVYLFYIATTSCLFLAILAVFSLAGLGSTPPPSAALPKLAPAPPPSAATAQLDYPDLETGVMYSVSHPTEIATDPAGLFGRKQQLPPGGIFRLEGREENAGLLWYRITVNNGVENYTMYLKAEDLNWQDVQAVSTPDVQAAVVRRENIAQMLERMGRGRVTRTPPLPEPEPEPTATERIASALRDNLETLSSQGLLTAALAAAIATFAIVLTITIAVWVYTTRRWQKSSLFEEPAEERGEEFYEEPASGETQTDDS